jgi:hypothetical protein
MPATTVVLTRLRTRGLRGVRAVLRTTEQVLDDCRAVPGFLGGRLAIDRHGDAWTLTVWESPEAVRAFGVRHAPVAATLDDVASESVMRAFRQPGRLVPSWDDAAVQTGLGRPRGPALRRSVAAPRSRAAASA